MLDHAKLNDAKEQLQELEYAERLQLIYTVASVPQSAVKKEIAAVNRRMLINKICEDYTGRSILDARPSDIAKCKSVLEQMDESALLLEELEVVINLILEYVE